MGCTCTQKIIRRKSSLNPNTLQQRDLDKISSSVSGITVLEEVTNPNINVLVWTALSSYFSTLFPSTFITCKSQNSFINFNIIPLSSSKNISDCLLIYSNSAEDRDQILSLCQTYKKINTKILVSPSNPFSSFSDLLTTVPSLEDFFTEAVKQLSNIDRNLKKIFNDLDTNENGMIDWNELCDGLSRQGLSLTAEERKDYMTQLDLNKDGKISFSEFSYWWKRGRQGGKSFKKITEKFSEKINEVLPERNEYLGRLVINKSKVRKNLKVEIGNEQECKLGISVFFASSGKREEILRPVNNLLSLNIYETWIAVKVKFKSEALAKYNLLKLEEMMKNIKFDILASVNIGSDIESGVLTKSIQVGSENYLCLILDINNDHIEELLKLGEKLDRFCKSPNDDFFDLKITSTLSLSEIDLNKNLIESIENGSILITCEHWEILESLITPKSYSDSLLLKFLSLKGDMFFSNPSLPLSSLKYYIDLALYPLCSLISKNQVLKKLFTSFNSDLYPDLEFTGRYNNLGFYLSITDPLLSSFFNV